MDFYIMKNATLPILKLQLAKDGRSDYHNYDNLSGSTIQFSMIDTETNIPKITSQIAQIVVVPPTETNPETEYYITYQFTEKNTNKIGKYLGQFSIKSDQGDVLLQQQDEIYIYILDSFVEENNCCATSKLILPIPATLPRPLGREYSEDRRDLNYLIVNKVPPKVLKPAVTITSRQWPDEVWWGNQGNTPTCVGYAWAHYIEDGPVTHVGLKPIISPITIYKEAQKIDEWPGENYAGTSVRAGAKYLHNTKKISSYLWAYDVNTLINTVLNVGPVVVGTNWYYGMFFPDRTGRIRVSGYRVGGHAYVINGVDTRTQLFRIKNSWGRRWGVNGRAFISFSDMTRLIRERGEICLPVENNF